MSRSHAHFREILYLKENLNLSCRTENVYFPSIKSLSVIQQKYRGMKKAKQNKTKKSLNTIINNVSKRWIFPNSVMNRRYAITSSVKTYCNCPCRWRYFSSLFPFSFTFIISFLYWWRGENEVMLSGVFLECLNERRLSFIQNNLFLETSTHRNYFLSRKYTKYYCFWLLQSCKTTPLNHSYKLCEDNLKKNYNCHCLLSCGVFAVDLYVYSCLRRGRGEGGIVHVQNV